jgi:cytochrome P450
LHEELDAVLGGRSPEVQDLARLPYTDWIVKESLRLYPPAWTTTREPQEDVVLGGYAIPKGSTIFLSQWVSHRDPRYFDRPEQFVPERWADGFEKRLPKGAYFPFAMGPRVCIGNAFALMEARLVLAAMAQRYRLELLPGQTIAPQPLITLRPRDGIRMRVVER